MRIAYLDCMSGVSGDMMLGGLVDLGVPLAEIQSGIDSLGLPSCRLEAREVKRKGFRATKVSVVHEPEHAHRHLHHITEMIDQSALTARQQDLAKRIFTRLGEAEAKVHGTTLRKVHFHEVGAVDSIADIVGTAIGWDLLGAEQLVCSPVPTGTGHVTIAHGRVSVPAPATAELLQGIPLAASDVAFELATPTGAAIVATLAAGFGPLPAMTIDGIGYGAGDRDLEMQANILRLLTGEIDAEPQGDRICLLETNLDDASGEVVGHTASLLMELGALDVYTTPIQMKKNRPGVMLTVLCSPQDQRRMEEVLFRETGTLGIRHCEMRRHKLHRRPVTVTCPFGEIAGKVARLAGGEEFFAPEYESCAAAARAQNQPLRIVYEAARRAFEA